MGSMKRILKNNYKFLIILCALIIINIRFEFFYIKTGSMEPELPTGTIVMVDPHDIPQIGEVFAYENHGSIIIHRIVGKEGGSYIFQGDANPAPDGVAVEADQLIGKVVARMKFFAPALKSIQSY